jgi:hypothetical protein
VGVVYFISGVSSGVCVCDPVVCGVDIVCVYCMVLVVRGV